MDKLAITVKEMAGLLGLSEPKAYELVHIEGFPMIQLGRKIIIPVSALERWLEENSGKEVTA